MILATILLNTPYFLVMDIFLVDGAYVPYFVRFGETDGFTVYSWIRALLVQFLPVLLLVASNAYLLFQVIPHIFIIIPLNFATYVVRLL